VLIILVVDLLLWVKAVTQWVLPISVKCILTTGLNAGEGCGLFNRAFIEDLTLVIVSIIEFFSDYSLTSLSLLIRD
jgi:hypothetical protein